VNKKKKKTCWKELTFNVVEEKSLQNLVAHAIGEVKLWKKDRHKIVKGDVMKEGKQTLLKKWASKERPTQNCRRQSCEGEESERC
jgi:hypothetical protein